MVELVIAWRRRRFAELRSIALPLLVCAIFVLSAAYRSSVPGGEKLLLRQTAVRRPKTYPPACRWTYEETDGGYPPVANDGRRDLADYVCPSMFRDLSDYVYEWPFDHFGENRVWVADPDLAAENLPPVPIIYSHSDRACGGDLHTAFLQTLVRGPYILITGQSDVGVPSQCAHANDILDDPRLVMWFAQNAEREHPKITSIPIGLNCFVHGPEMHSTLQDMKRKGRPPRTRQLLVNFGPTHPHRQEVWSQLCERNHTFADCQAKTSTEKTRGNAHLLQLYKDFASHNYVASPRGNGLDCHRFWESLYLGVTPIVEHSPLDALYQRAENVLFVESFADVTEEMLTRDLPHFRDVVQRQGGRPPRVLTRTYWLEIIEGVRARAIEAYGLTDVIPRKRCWGLVI